MISRRPLREANDRLWAALRLGRAGQRFRRHVALGPLLASFYCPALKLVIEVDAGQDRRAALVAERNDLWLWRNGYVVLRLDRAEVMQNRDKALAMISEIARSLRS